MSKKYNCAGVAVFRNKNNILETVLVKTKAGHYSMPKGKRTKNEDNFECAIRELEEETGILPDMINLGTDIYIEKDNIIYYVAKIKPEYNDFKLKISDPEELEEICWMDIEKVKRLDEKSLKPVRRVIIEQASSVSSV